MALIQCPHCGERVSDTVERCIHCGKPILKKESKMSATDFYALGKDKRQSFEAEFQKGHTKYMCPYAKQIALKYRRRHTIFYRISLVAGIIFFLFLILTLTKVLDLDSDDTMLMIVNYLNVTPEKYLRVIASYASDVAQIDTLFYMSVFMSIIIPGIIDVLADFFSKYNFAKWIRSNHIDISQEINSAISRSTSKKEKKDDDEEFSLNRAIKESNEEENIERTDSACYIATNPNKAYLLAVIQFVSKIAWWVLEIFVLRWSSNMLIAFLNSVVMGEFETNSNGSMTFIKNFKIEWWPSVLWAGIILVVAILIQIASKKIKEKIIVKTLMKVQKKS